MSTYDTAWYEVVEAEHEFQNPVNVESIRLLGRRLGLGPSSRLLDVGAGRCGPAIVLAETFRCHLTCVEASAEFAAGARERIAAACVGPNIELVEEDAESFLWGEKKSARYDAALCLGASFILGGLESTVRQLFVRAPFVAVGEPYTNLRRTVSVAENTGVRVVSILTSSEADWQEYEAKRLRTLERWLDRGENDDLAEEYRARELAAQEKRRAENRGWAILICA